MAARSACLASVVHQRNRRPQVLAVGVCGVLARANAGVGAPRHPCPIQLMLRRAVLPLTCTTLKPWHGGRGLQGRHHDELQDDPRHRSTTLAAAVGPRRRVLHRPQVHLARRARLLSHGTPLAAPL